MKAPVSPPPPHRSESPGPGRTHFLKSGIADVCRECLRTREHNMESQLGGFCFVGHQGIFLLSNQRQQQSPPGVSLSGLTVTNRECLSHCPETSCYLMRVSCLDQGSEPCRTAQPKSRSSRNEPSCFREGVNTIMWLYFHVVEVASVSHKCKL